MAKSKSATQIDPMVKYATKTQERFLEGLFKQSLLLKIQQESENNIPEEGFYFEIGNNGDEQRDGYEIG